MVRRSSFSRNSRSSRGADAIRYLRDGGLSRYALNDGGQDGFRRLPIGMSVEIQNDAMPQDAGRYRLHVFHSQVETAAHQRVNAPAFDQRLGAAGRAAVAHILARQFVG